MPNTGHWSSTLIPAPEVTAHPIAHSAAGGEGPGERVATQRSEGGDLGQAEHGPAHGAHHDQAGERGGVADERRTSGQADAEPDRRGGDPTRRCATPPQHHPLHGADHGPGDEPAEDRGAGTVDRSGERWPRKPAGGKAKAVTIHSHHGRTRSRTERRMVGRTWSACGPALDGRCGRGTAHCDETLTGRRDDVADSRRTLQPGVCHRSVSAAVHRRLAT